jgi:hypothetical protein
VGHQPDNNRRGCEERRNSDSNLLLNCSKLSVMELVTCHKLASLTLSFLERSKDCRLANEILGMNEVSATAEIFIFKPS